MAEFLWGASTSGHQVEGNNVNSDWWAREQSLPQMYERSGDAVDSYHRYAEDMQLLADAGLNSYRFGIEWARIEPDEGHFSRAELQHYRRMIETAQTLGLEPVVTLQHFTVPAWFRQSGGWMSPNAIDRFRSYVEACVPILHDVRWIVTINEPNILALMALMDQAIASYSADDVSLSAGAKAMSKVVPDSAISGRLIEAHKAAREVLKGAVPGAVGWTVAGQSFVSTPGNETLYDSIKYAWEDRFLEASRGDDFVGVQAYTSQNIDANGIVPHPDNADNTLTGWAYRPDAIGIALRNAAEVTGGTPALITENGIATTDDERRINYTETALLHVAEAIDDGIDVRGYLHWSALDNFEWGHWEPTFGLIAVDRESFVRTPKPSLGWLGRVAREGRPTSQSVLTARAGVAR